MARVWSANAQVRSLPYNTIYLVEMPIIDVVMEDNLVHTLPLGQAMHAVVCACEVFFLFCYLEVPETDDFCNLLHAREVILAVNARYEQPMKITVHDMTNHCIQFAIEDGTLYTSLNEGAEKSNDEFRKDIRNIGVGPEKMVGKGSSDILEIYFILQDLRRELKRFNGLGYAPEKWMPKTPSASR